MEFNNKKLEKTSKFINYLIAFLVFIFLVSLSDIIMDDVDSWKERPTVEQYENQQLINNNQSAIKAIEDEIGVWREKKITIEKTIAIAQNNYKNAKSSFDNWLAARKTVGSPKEDKEVLSRAKILDDHYKTQQEWRKELLAADTQIAAFYGRTDSIRALNMEERDIAYEKYNTALQQYDLKVFLIRLLFILPILLLGIFFIMKFRKHKYWPLFLGFVLFSFYSFFFGLVPYLPSYGGYIRYSVGIILSVLFGIYAINNIRAFMERKKNELKVSTTERAKKVQTETAEKALDNHMCPSCGKDFIANKWGRSALEKDKIGSQGMITNFCRFCGLELFKKCKTCGTENFAHLPFCSNCGDTITVK